MQLRDRGGLQQAKQKLLNQEDKKKRLETLSKSRKTAQSKKSNPPSKKRALTVEKVEKPSKSKSGSKSKPRAASNKKPQSRAPRSRAQGEEPPVYSITEASTDYDAKKMKTKKFTELEKMLKSSSDDKKLLAIFTLFQRMNTEECEELRAKIIKAGVQPLIADVINRREDFRIIVLKYLAAFFADELEPEVCEEAQKLYTPALKKLTQEDDFDYVVLSVNLLGKFYRNHPRPKKDLNNKEFGSLIQTVLDAREDVEEKQEMVVAVKYFIFNILLEMAGNNVRPDFAYSWVCFTIRILNQGLVRHRKSRKYEAWLQEESDVQEKMLRDHPHTFVELTSQEGACFYLLYALPLQKHTLLNIKGVREKFHKELKAYPNGAV